jgi:Leucine-rich repeat (LRR) protein
MQYLAPLTNLRVLELNGTRITDQSFVHLKNLNKLEEINVSRCSAITGRGFEALRGAPLRVVSAGATQFGRFGLFHLKGCRTLEELVATRCNVTDAALVHLKSCKGLRKLWLSHNSLSDLGAKQLGAHRRLVELHLRNTGGISDVGLKFIKNMKQLEKLDLEGTAVSPRGVEALRKLLKGCTILYQDRQWKGDKAA